MDGRGGYRFEVVGSKFEVRRRRTSDGFTAEAQSAQSESKKQEVYREGHEGHELEQTKLLGVLSVSAVII